MNVILCEKTYYESNWCKQILHGLKNELKKRRIEYKVIFEFEEIKTDDILFVIGSDYRWISDSVYASNLYGITPIVVFNQLNHMIEGRYHSVSSDINGSICSIVDWLKSRNKKNICLYGVNPSSISDISRSQSYMRTFTDGGRTFFNNGSLKNCFNGFIESNERFEAVICTNDFAAISLVKNLIEYDATLLEDMDIISCSQSSISACYKDYIKSININFTSFGTNAYEVSRIAQRGENISEISLTVKWNMDFNTENIKSSNAVVETKEDSFYDDVELSQMLKIDRLIERCDVLDKEIIKLILDEKTYIDISEECHIAEQSVKYRVKQYVEICGLKNRKELIALLNEYHITM